MDPTQFARGPELLGTKLPADQYLGVGDFSDKPVKVLQLNECVLRKLTLKARPEPLRRIPEFEAMMDSEEDFHEGFADLRKCS